MKTIPRLICISVITFASTVVCFAQDSGATAKGKAIGETINAAINAALPGANAIGNLIKTLLGDEDKKKISKEQLNTALKDQGDILKKEAQKQLKALSSAVIEIKIANDLATKSQTAYENLLITKYLVTLKSDAGWEAFKNQWEKVATSSLDDIKRFDPAALGKISNENIQGEWQGLMTQYTRLINDVNTFSSQKDVALTVSSLNTLIESVKKLATIPSVELRAFSAQLSDLASQVDAIRPTTGPVLPAPPTEAVLNNFFIEINETLKKMTPRI